MGTATGSSAAWPRRALWIAWWLAVAGLAVSTGWYLERALRSGELLVELLPPVGAALPPLLAGMALCARPRPALAATLVGWALVAVPVIAYLVMHLPQAWTPRGIELLLALGPGALFVPLLVAWRCRVGLHQEDDRLR